MGYTFIEKQSDLDGILPILMAADPWAVDTETTGLDPNTNKVVLLQIGNESIQYVIDTRKVNIEPLRPFFESKSIRKIAHNAKFDYKMMRGSFGICMERLRDTYLAEKLMHMGRKFSGFGLADLAKLYLDMALDKSVRSSFGTDACLQGDFSREQIEYAARDVEVLIKILRKQMVLLERDGLLETWALECDAVPCFGDMEFDGMCFNQEKWKEIIKDNVDQAEEAKVEMDLIASRVMPLDLFGQAHVNWSSPEQVVDVLKTLRIKVDQKNLATGKYESKLINKSDDKTLKKVRDNRIVQLLKKYRGHMIRVNTFGYPYLEAVNPTTGRLHPDFEQLGTETGRIANRGKVTFLSVPREKRFRNCFHGEDYEVVETHDYSGCELRIWAEISGDPALTEAFSKGIDVHCYVGSMMYGKEVTKKSPERTPSKTLNFGICYGMSPYSLFEKLNGDGYPITLSEAKELFNKYCKNMETGIGFIRSMGKQAARDGFLVSISGRRRYWLLPDPADKTKYPEGFRDQAYKGRMAGIEREGGNMLIQSVNADMTKLAMIKIRNYVKKNNIRSKFMNQVYDEIVTRTHKDDSPDFNKIKEKLMLEAAQVYLKKIPMEVEGSIEPYWTK